MRFWHVMSECTTVAGDRKQVFGLPDTEVKSGIQNVSPKASTLLIEGLGRMTYMCGKWLAANPCSQAEKDRE